MLDASCIGRGCSWANPANRYVTAVVCVSPLVTAELRDATIASGAICPSAASYSVFAACKGDVGKDGDAAPNCSSLWRAYTADVAAGYPSPLGTQATLDDCFARWAHAQQHGVRYGATRRWMLGNANELADALPAGVDQSAASFVELFESHEDAESSHAFWMAVCAWMAVGMNAPLALPILAFCVVSFCSGRREQDGSASGSSASGVEQQL